MKSAASFRGDARWGPGRLGRQLNRGAGELGQTRQAIRYKCRELSLVGFVFADRKKREGETLAGRDARDVGSGGIAVFNQIDGVDESECDDVESKLRVEAGGQGFAKSLFCKHEQSLTRMRADVAD